MKVLVVVGARPQFIKASLVSRALADASIEEFIVHTGQHYDSSMSQVFFDELGLRQPDINLDVGSGTHASQTARMLTGLETAILGNKPDSVLVYGDTNSTLAGALAAAKLHVHIAHVEAGLRSFNRDMPEEVNRLLVDAVSDLLFAPTETALRNLQREGVLGARAAIIGDLSYDALLTYGPMADAKSRIMERLVLHAHGFVLVTVHRAENVDNQSRLRTIVEALVIVAKEYPVIWPVHPRTQSALKQVPWAACPGLRLIEPVGYLDLLQLEKNACAIATDSGGIQKEALIHRVPCVTMRNETEWVESVDFGWNRLCPPTSASVLARTILETVGIRGSAGRPYGDGNASRRVVERLARCEPNRIKW